MIRATIQAGKPREFRGIVITPLFPRTDPAATYITLDEALSRGLEITEVTEAGTVPELTVRNPLADRVLLYDGEELVGAKQNRILNVTVLVEAESTLNIPVSCVEQGRWSARSDQFDSAVYLSHPELRRRKAASLAAAPFARGLAQAEVWDAVADKARRMHVASPTGANADTFTSRAGQLAELEAAFPLEAGQCGAVLGLGDTLCLDWVSRPDAFAALWPKIRAGYLLDGLERLDQPHTSVEATQGFIRRIADAELTLRSSVAVGRDLRLSDGDVTGSGLELNGELIQLTAFAAPNAERPSGGRLARPSQRR